MCEHFDRLGLLTHQPYMLTEGVPLPSIGELDVVGNDYRPFVVGIGRDFVVSLEMLRCLPALVMAICKHSANPNVDIAIEYKPQVPRLRSHQPAVPHRSHVLKVEIRIGLQYLLVGRSALDE